jgi:hypothetical protein
MHSSTHSPWLCMVAHRAAACTRNQEHSHAHNGRRGGDFTPTSGAKRLAVTSNARKALTSARKGGMAELTGV